MAGTMQKLAKLGSLTGFDLLWHSSKFWKELMNGKAADTPPEAQAEAPSGKLVWPDDDKYPKTPWR
jgi:hypothetical protein